MVTEPLDLDDETQSWDRQEGESPQDYAAFRIYRDLPPTQRRMATVSERASISERQARQLAREWDWRERAGEWDDLLHRTEDHERLEAIRQMHLLHRSAGRQAMTKAMAALQTLQPGEMTPSTIARLMELGAKLERSTLIVSVEELQGFETDDDEAEDAWERIARELDPQRADDID